MNKVEEMAFEATLQDAIEQAKEFDYHPNRFIGMIASKGGFQTVKDIVASGKPSDGFDKLVLEGRIELTCESIIVETAWRRFFDDDLLEIAEKRLTKYGHKWQAPVQSKDVPVESTSPLSNPISLEVDDFIPSEHDHREKALRESYCRPGQTQFRATLIAAYGARCMISGTSIEEALEAAHICAYRGENSNHVQNGLLLRADLHNLFDRFMLSIEPEAMTVHLSPRLKEIEGYRALEGARIEPVDSHAPSRKALRVHWSIFREESA